MYTKLLLLSLLFCYSESRQKFTIRSEVWKAKIQSCNSWGEYQETYKFDLPNLSSIGLKYDDIDDLTTVKATFENMNVETKAVKNAGISHLFLSDWSSTTSMKQFSGSHKYTAVCGWATQAVKVKLTLQFFNDGKVKMQNYVYAASWGAVSCATTQADVSSFEITV